ncbi:hypothetical protein [Candidatus Nitrotoga sp. 1052]|uniref:hypothetical protein n=1 Tax=Candidatus Nitrotoga sp. 1052 TaxID=2886964 RepID=UPI001EF66F38|nr:hypothetical protein [Candidatus Nitrotoga sp. 1052]CAH1087078.1 hypothetical protein NTG1052_590014 [Candidatus Nitrotoga sp. 1052]
MPKQRNKSLEANGSKAGSVADKTQHCRNTTLHQVGAPKFISVSKRGGVAHFIFIRDVAATLEALPALECCGVADKTAFFWG